MSMPHIVSLEDAGDPRRYPASGSEEYTVESAAYLRDRLPRIPHFAVILGSGLSGVAAGISQQVRIPYGTVPNYPDISVPGHSAEFILGGSDTMDPLLLLGRPHFYENGSIADVLYPVRLLRALGISCLLITNAAGSLKDEFTPGSLMVIENQIDMTFLPHPPCPDPPGGGIYDSSFTEKLTRAASMAGISLHRGVYCGVRGPAYETPAESRMLKMIGASVVGMSTVHEARLASCLGMKVAGISVISNPAPTGGENLRHSDVLDRSAEASVGLGRLIKVLSSLVGDF